MNCQIPWEGFFCAPSPLGQVALGFHALSITTPETTRPAYGHHLSRVIQLSTSATPAD